jgi:hypothetical protein
MGFGTTTLIGLKGTLHVKTPNYYFGLLDYLIRLALLLVGWVKSCPQILTNLVAKRGNIGVLSTILGKYI